MNFRENENLANEISAKISASENVLLIAHRNPDGDTIGAAAAFFKFLNRAGKKVKIFCVDDFSDDFEFLSDAAEWKNSDFVDANFAPCDFDLIIALDCGADYMTGLHERFPEIFDGNFPLLNIDHHPSNDFFGRWNLIDPTAAAACVILTEFFDFQKIEICPAMATALLCGVATDTGSFQHSNTNARVLRIAARLVRRGGDLSQISRNIFRRHKIEKLKLWGRVLRRAQKNSENFIVSRVNEKDFLATGTTTADLSGVIDFLNSVPNSKFSLLITDAGGKVKASFRTLRDDVDVAALAEKFGGGGHKKAAGFTVPGKLQREVKWKIVRD